MYECHTTLSWLNVCSSDTSDMLLSLFKRKFPSCKDGTRAWIYKVVDKSKSMVGLCMGWLMACIMILVLDMFAVSNTC